MPLISSELFVMEAIASAADAREARSVASGITRSVLKREAASTVPASVVLVYSRMICPVAFSHDLAVTISWRDALFDNAKVADTLALLKTIGVTLWEESQ